MTYADKLLQKDIFSFDSIIELNKSLLPAEYRTCSWRYPGLSHGTAVLTTEEQCSAYIAAYGSMHQSKINEVLDKIRVDDFRNNDIQIIDWGCGQGLATVCLFDFFTAYIYGFDLSACLIFKRHESFFKSRFSPCYHYGYGRLSTKKERLFVFRPHLRYVKCLLPHNRLPKTGRVRLSVFRLSYCPFP